MASVTGWVSSDAGNLLEMVMGSEEELSCCGCRAVEQMDLQLERCLGGIVAAREAECLSISHPIYCGGIGKVVDECE